MHAIHSEFLRQLEHAANGFPLDDPSISRFDRQSRPCDSEKPLEGVNPRDDTSPLDAVDIPRGKSRAACKVRL